MPEGHTVHRLAQAFREQFVGSVVQASSPQGRFAGSAGLIDGHEVRAAEAYGKQMFLEFSDHLWLRVHLGLYGNWRFFGPGLEGVGRRRAKLAEDAEFPPPPRGAVRLRLVARAHVADLSGPTACELLSPDKAAAAIVRCGADPLRRDADAAGAYAKLHASRTALGLLLMRQDIVAGIGNIYRAELLFRARLDPHRPGRELAEAAWEALWSDTVKLLRDGLRGGRIVTTEPRDRPRKRDAAKTGAVRREDATYVAHRAGKPCRVCGNPVCSEPMGGRTLYWCPHCQVD